ncbi:hypothetical protein AB3Y40_05585 [Yoonia sp. R2331]|uniref:hypothetical protein n=1 Tax=Yoonia sp. R2331 TaxID=3237238 RepID=UPI0034E52C75
MAQGFSLKDDLFNATTVARLAQGFEAAGVFKAAPFEAAVMAQMPPLELKARINMIADVLTDFLPADFPAAATAIQSALPPQLDPTLTDDDFGHFIFAPLGVYVENHGIEGHLSTALDLLAELTQRFSMEYSIRAFLNRWPDPTLARMQDWVRHDSYHVRRLVSEGTRPKLPWGQSIGIGADQTLPLLDTLHGDRTRFVTRSVANHLNDITKKQPELALERLAQWAKLDHQTPKELDWMTRHALRGLVKAGHPGAMAQLGYTPDVALTNAEVTMAPAALAIGDAAEVSVTLTTKTDAPLIVDYVIDFVKANGSSAPKVFKMKVLQAKAGEPVVLKKKHLFKKGATTFTHYPGAHRVHLQVNGRQVAAADFALS